MEEIVNKIAKSSLININLEDYYPSNKIVNLDISQFLLEGLLLREKDYRQKLKDHDWKKYKDALVALNCSTDAIIPGWTYLLICVYLKPFSTFIYQGNEEELVNAYFSKIINEQIDFEEFRDKKIIINGCANKPIPENAVVSICNNLLPVVSSLMFGEACSTVPLYKRKK